MPADRDPTERTRALATFRSEAAACTRCHARGWLHVEDGQTAGPLFHLEATGRAPILCVMEAPNRDDTFEPAKGRLTVGGQTDPTGRFLEELRTWTFAPRTSCARTRCSACRATTGAAIRSLARCATHAGPGSSA